MVKEYGIFTASVEPVELETGDTINVIFLRNAAGDDLVEVAKANPSNWYIALDANNRVISMENDIEQSQIADKRIVGIDSSFGFTRGQGGTVYGKMWNGSAIIDLTDVIIPEEISRRQFFQQLAVMEIITKDEAMAALQSGAIPAALQAILDQLPTDDDRFNAQMLIIGAAAFNCHHALSETVRLAFGWTVEQRDDFWREAAKL